MYERAHCYIYDTVEGEINAASEESHTTGCSRAESPQPYEVVYIADGYVCLRTHDRCEVIVVLNGKGYRI